MPTTQAVTQAYASRRHGQPEPQLTAARVAYLIDPALAEESSHLSDRKRHMARVRSALERARRAGKLGSSIGFANGREARMYEPLSLEIDEVAS